jgi:two-component sensor histidine kinase
MISETASQHLLAQAIVDTVRNPMLVLDGQLSVTAASRSFYDVFKTTADKTIGRRVYDLGQGEWNHPALRLLLERILPEHGVMDDFEIEQDFPSLGTRTMLLNAREVYNIGNADKTLLLVIEDTTDRRNAEKSLKILNDQRDVLLSEMGHRIGNSLQIVASILMMKARSVKSEETRGQLEDAHRRVMSVATLQKHLTASGSIQSVNVGSYLKKLCASLSESMVGTLQSIIIDVQADDGELGSEQAVSVGLIVVELAINALKHAFSGDVKNGRILVSYEMDAKDWKLVVSDNGSGYSATAPNKATGLGTSLVAALSQKLDAQLETVSNKKGTTISVTHATFQSTLPTAA